ncbi:MAG: hypothetical protein B7Y07_00550 [Halothiobacillus sp. 24-54-40]|jgi:hypothetical protein|nr:MAG: hypothetical protein B7Y58_00585 [Halothiobacillus sp. 35-54-62]OYZ88193.1 MAG: hypothetical protein B7Y07_00550 [Halothiobacillus sp. 24-54-40]OZA80695.1 MAG: hypothetical protein B7X64_04890 [Halothiobacillus sp. 39-53-45]HQS01853.1 hypothetical protein [Halothiobacillus sp.]HQS28681.1 hypothetical protein [Halothiobacillus sp.]
MKNFSALIGGVFLIFIAAGLAGCSAKDPDFGVNAQTPVQVERDVRALFTELKSGDIEAAKAAGLIMLPSRWRAQGKQNEELNALAARLKTESLTQIGSIKIASRWALVDSISLDGKPFQAEKPWFFFFYAGHWAWVTPSAFKDPAISGMMDVRFDRLYQQWKADHGIASD